MMNLSPMELKICLCLMDKPLKVHQIMNDLNDRQGKLPKHINCKHIKKGLCMDKKACRFEKPPSAEDCTSCGRHHLRLYSESHIYNYVLGTSASNKLLDAGVLKLDRKKRLTLCEGCNNGILVVPENKLIYVCPQQDFCIEKDANNGCYYSHLNTLLRI